ncbi:MAG: KamA family radical SAM protein, partial [Promethearchaeota archaeon]
QFNKRITTVSELSKYINLKPKEKDEISQVLKKYRMSITPYYANLMNKENPEDPIRKIAIPSSAELFGPVKGPDEKEELKAMPIKGIRQRYPDRALIILSYRCPNYCRFCFRKRWIGQVDEELSYSEIDEAIEYVQKDVTLREMIVTGGEPLILDENKLEYILQALRSIKHVEIIRIGERIPATLPSRITQELTKLLGKYKPIYIVTHFDHPREINVLSKRACDMLADAGIPLFNQTVLLKNINDNLKTLRDLFLGLLSMRIKPYYLFHCIDTLGTAHFVTKVGIGANIIKRLQCYISGLALPNYVIPTYYGKIPITYNFVLNHNRNILTLENYKGEVFKFTEPI